MQRVSFASADGLEIFGHLTVADAPGKHPCVLMVTGGIHGGVYQEDGAYDPLHIAITQYLATHGFTSLIVDKRGSKGYGPAYQAHLDMNGKEVDDVLAGIAYLASLPSTDLHHLTMHGMSRGASTIALALTRTNAVRAAILASGFYDVAKEYEFERLNRQEIWPTRQSLGGKDLDAIDVHDRSPLFHAHKVSAAILLQHGQDDPIVPTKMSIEYYDALRAAGKDAQLALYPHMPHTKKHQYPTEEAGARYWKDCVQYLRSKS